MRELFMRLFDLLSNQSRANRNEPRLGNLCYSHGMPKQPLIKTNPYLRSSTKRREMFAMTVYTSTGIEGVHLDESDLDDRTTITERVPPIRRESLKSSRSRQ